MYLSVIAWKLVIILILILIGAVIFLVGNRNKWVSVLQQVLESRNNLTELVRDRDKLIIKQKHDILELQVSVGLLRSLDIEYRAVKENDDLNHYRYEIDIHNAATFEEVEEYFTEFNKFFIEWTNEPLQSHFRYNRMKTKMYQYRFIEEAVDDTDGLKVKYNVTKLEDDSVVNGCFVLRPDKDTAALKALKTYSMETNNVQLKIDIIKWIVAIEMKAIKEGDKDESSE